VANGFRQALRGSFFNPFFLSLRAQEAFFLPHDKTDNPHNPQTASERSQSGSASNWASGPAHFTCASGMKPSNYFRPGSQRKLQDEGKYLDESTRMTHILLPRIGVSCDPGVVFSFKPYEQGG